MKTYELEEIKHYARQITSYAKKIDLLLKNYELEDGTGFKDTEKKVQK